MNEGDVGVAMGVAERVEACVVGEVEESWEEWEERWEDGSVLFASL